MHRLGVHGRGSSLLGRRGDHGDGEGAIAARGAAQRSGAILERAETMKIPAASGENITLGDLRRSDRKMHGECIECGRAREIDPARVALPDYMQVADAGLKMRCRDCHGSRIYTAVLECAE